ncbi:hypothetical protein NSU_3784 [Novosphingobium pentaromativorans US6-1]|uniref:Uncharacterized protein n=1 Tax=Novosphingobium pentaromativorans US6-1 TaxID=1088721 RepID=G6EHG3_9SPHN|nr:hypothetical protein NSU_3784 [Novosphingobium pentaromativorans US6-1]
MLGTIRYCHRRSPPRLVRAPLGPRPKGRCRDRLGTGWRKPLQKHSLSAICCKGYVLDRAGDP